MLSVKIGSVLLMVGGCLPMKPPAQNAGPALSETGIQIAVLRQSCSQTQEPGEYGWDLVDETIEIQVRNGSSDPLTVHRDRFHLLTPDGYSLKTQTWRSGDPLLVVGGGDQVFELRFMTRGGLECRKEMRLDPDAGITVRERPIAFQPVSFVPSRAL